METVAVVLSVKPDAVEAFEAGFREHEVPIWTDFHERGVMLRASLSKLDISNVAREGAIQYMVVVDFATEEGHHLHDSDPRFEAWNQLADQYQVGDGIALGGETLIKIGG